MFKSLGVAQAKNRNKKEGIEMTDQEYMLRAIQLAKKGEGWTNPNPMVGAIIVKEGKIIGEGYHMCYGEAHAEVNAFNNAKEDTKGACLYVTLEPCPMCAGAIIQSRIKEVVYGASDPKGGCVGTCTNLFEVSEFNHHPEYRKGILESECSDLLKHFFKKKRDMKKKQKS